MKYGSTACVVALGAVILVTGCGEHGDEPQVRESQEHAGEASHEEPSGHATELHLEEKAALACGISTEKVSRRTFRNTFRVAARSVPDPEASAHVGTPVAGRIRELRAQIGVRVHPGDVLAVLDSPELGEAQADYLQKSDAIRSARIPLDPLRSSYERAKALLESSAGGSMTRTEVERREVELRNAEAELGRAEAGQRAAENRLRVLGVSHEEFDRLARTGEIATTLELKCPVQGTVVDREATLGQFVSAGGEKLFVIADLTRLWVIADLPEARLADVALKQQVRVEFKAVGVESTGEVLLFGSEVSSVTRTLPIRIALRATDERLRPGLFADVEIDAGQKDGVAAQLLAVPRDAVQTVGGRPVVFAAVKDEPWTFVAKAVVLGPASEGHVAILGGIEEEDEIVVHGAFYLKADLGKAAFAEQD